MILLLIFVVSFSIVGSIDRNHLKSKSLDPVLSPNRAAKAYLIINSSGDTQAKVYGGPFPVE